jgi:iron complex outermembrane recepter protein
MKKIITLAFFVLSVLELQAQGGAPAVGKITGNVLDAQSKKAVEFATVSVFSMRDSALVTGGVSDESGAFLVDKVPYGGYYVEINFIGYEKQTFKPVVIRPDALTHAIGTFNLAASASNLDEVNVTAEKSTLQLGVDRKIFNVDKTAVAKGGTATDVLRATPTLNVDMNGNISLRGSQGVTILINGRPSALSGGNRKALLDQIPASMVERIEIITNPSAKYDPDGLSGIINIVLKKNKLEGFSGNVSGGVGTIFNKWDFQSGIAYQNEKFNIYANYSYNNTSRYSNFNSFRNTISQDTSFYLQTIGGSRKRNYTHFAKVGIDFTPNEYTTLSFSGSANPNGSNDRDTNNYININDLAQQTNGSNRFGEDSDKGLALEGNFNLNQKFKKHAGRELVFDANISRNAYTENNSYRQEYFNYSAETFTPWLQRTSPDYTNQTATLQLDYTQPSKDKSRKWELGAKSIFRNINNAMYAENYNHSSQNYSKDTTISNTFEYGEQVHAIYSTYGGKYKKFNYQAGLRLEQALTRSYLVETDSAFVNNYFSFFPSAHLGYQVKEGHQLQLSYSRRITRPSLWTLNPFPSYSDPLNLRKGNPFILPEYTNSFDLSYVAYFGSLSLSNSLYFRHSTNVLRRLVSVDTLSGVSTVSYFNFDQTNQYGVEMVLGGMVAKIIRMNLSANVYKVVEDGTNLGDEFTNNALWANFSIYANITIPKGALKGLQTEIVCAYTPPMQLAQGKIVMGAWSSIALSKSFLKNKLTVSLRVEDPFNLQKFAYNTGGSSFSNIGEYKWESRIAWLNVNYTFGKMSQNTRRSRRGAGGGGNSGGGMGL